MSLFRKVTLIGGIPALLLLAGCSNESPWETSLSSDGKIELSVLTDGKVAIGSRADEFASQALEPLASQFAISLVSKDGSIDRTWESVAKFNNEDGFPMGSYTISASYGDPDVEGFDNPYYYGEEEIEVSLGHTTVQTITATVGNSMLSVRYTDYLKEMFKAYSSAVETTGHNPVAFVQEEERPAYLKSSEAKFYVTLTNDKDETVTVNLMDLNLSPRHHYIVTVGVNKDNLGVAVLDVNVTEDIIIEDPIEIVLSDEFFSAPVPVITPVGFDPEKSFDFFEAYADENINPEIQVMALAGLKSAKLNLSALNDATLPSWGSVSESVELINATSTDKSNVEQAKIRCVGFYENAAEFAYIEFGDFIKNLTPGSYKASLTVTDKLGRTTDVSLPPVELKANVEEVKYEIAGCKNPDFFSEEIFVALTTNCPLIKDAFSFEANDKDGGIVGVEKTVLSENPGITDLQETYANTFYYKLKVDPINDNQWTVKAKYSAKEQQKVLDVIMPEFSVATDAFAKRVKIVITAENPDLTEALTKIVNVKNNGNLLKPEDIDRSYASQGMLIVKKLYSKGQIVDGQPFSGVYDNMNLFLGKKTNRTEPNYPGIPYVGVPFAFETEEALDVPNGDFEDLTPKISITINQGGTWTDLTHWNLGRDPEQNKEVYNVSEPEYWATVNTKTCNLAASALNTWFVVPSTFNTSESKNGANAMVLRNVGFNYAGKVPGKQTNTIVHPYNSNNPGETSVHNAAGKLFLGSYSVNLSDLSETYLEGIQFNSRPLAITGWYKYSAGEADPNDKGVFRISIEKEDGVLITKTIKFDNASSWTQFSIPLDEYNDWGIKAETLKIFIASSYKESSSQSTEDTSILTKPYDEYTQKYLGSELTIDNLKFEY